MDQWDLTRDSEMVKNFFGSEKSTVYQPIMLTL